MLLLHVRLYKLLMLSNGMDFSSSLYFYTIPPTSPSDMFVFTSFEKKSKLAALLANCNQTFLSVGK